LSALCRCARQRRAATLAPFIERSASSHTHSRVNWSMTVRIRIVRPSASLSLTKSADQQWFGCARLRLGHALPAADLLALDAADFQVFLVVEAVNAFRVDLPSLAPQQYRQSPISVSNVRGREFAQTPPQRLLRIRPAAILQRALGQHQQPPTGGRRCYVSVAPTSPDDTSGEASELFSDDLLQDLPVNGKIGDQPFQAAVLFPQLTQLPQFLYAETGILLVPEVKSRLADAQLAADVGAFSPDSCCLSAAMMSSSVCPFFGKSILLVPAARGTQRLRYLQF
jgi:hypothetical protein